MRLKKVFSTLNSVKGLNVIDVLKQEHKNLIAELEDKNNIGVFEAIKRQHILLASHDSFFRPPAGEIAKTSENSIFFPPVPFPELDKYASNIVSASPSKKVHEALTKNLNLKSEEATLLIGFDLKPYNSKSES